MDDLLNEFLIETTENISVLDGELVQLEQNPNDPALLGNIFRLVHTIKGTCGFLGLPRLEAVAHAAENVLGKFRDGEMEVTPKAVTLILEAFDRIKLIISGLEQTESEPKGDDAALIAELNHFAEFGDTPPSESSEPAAGPPADLGSIVREPPPLEDAASDDSLPALSLWDGIGGLSSIDAAIDVFYVKVLADETLQPLFADAALDVVKGHQRDYLSEIAGGLDKCTADDRRLGHPHLGAPGLDESHFETIDAYFRESMRELEIDEATIEGMSKLLITKRNEILGDAVPVTPAASVEKPAVKEPTPKSAPTEANAAAPKPQESSLATQTIRVNVDLLETLMTMVSELVLSRNQLMQILRGRDDDSEFGTPLQRLSLVTTELQEGVMKTRMQPIGNAWAKLPRIVRDLSIELGKKIDLKMLGADTELDRQVLELIRDPLTHMVRNSGDHGIETPDVRRAAGKPDIGTITLNAYHEGGHIIIEISDDGRGLDIEKIKEKAVQSGLATEAEIETLSEQQIQQFIFKAGLSTAKQVTSVSGRGVGMDVVRTNIEKIGGNIELKSKAGKGSTCVIKIPLTLAIVSALLVESAGERFAIPQISVLELVRASDNSEHVIETIDDTPVLRLRNRLLPLVSLRTILRLEPEPSGRIGKSATAKRQSGSNQRAGHAAAVAAAAESFYDKILADDRLKQFFVNADMKAMKAGQRDFFAKAFGGPETCTGSELRRAYKHLLADELDGSHCDSVAQHLAETLAEFDVDTGSRNRIFAAIEATRDDFPVRDRKSAPAAPAEQTPSADEVDQRFIVVTQVGTHTFGIIVDRVFDTEEIVVKPVAPILRDISLFSGNTILGDGSVIMILDPNGIAATIGEVALQEPEAAEQTADRGVGDQSKTALLLFKAGDDSMKALPLALVARLEEFEIDIIETTNERPVVQYRGHLMPLVPAVPNQQLRQEGRQPVLVLADKDRSIGLLVDEIVDIIEEVLDVQQMSSTPGIMGSAIIAGRATEVIDAGHLLTQAFSDWFHSSVVIDRESDRRRVLVVDDSPFFRNLLTPLLSMAGYDVTSVEGADKAMALCEAGEDFDVILSDIDMPDMDGFQFAEAVRSSKHWQDKPLVALSSVTSPEARDRGREVGFTDYVAKSDRDALLQVLAQTVAARGGAA